MQALHLGQQESLVNIGRKWCFYPAGVVAAPIGLASSTTRRKLRKRPTLGYTRRMTTSTERAKRTYERRYNAGLCVRCGKRRRVENRKRCKTCLGLWRQEDLVEHRARVRKRYARLRKQGICTRCRVEPAEGGKSRCGVCAKVEAPRRQSLEAKYGLRPGEYKALVEKQGGECAVCGHQPTHRLAIDHDHGTGRVRGLLCNHCNTGLGCFKDSRLTLRSAIEYLRRFEELYG